MPNLASVLKDEIRRLAKKEARAEVDATRKFATQARRDIAELKRKVAGQQRMIEFLRKQEKRRVAKPAANAKDAGGARFSPKWVKAHRDKLDLSREKYGKLVGVTGLTIYSWETGKSRPRQQQLAALAAVRELGKREAQRRLEVLES